MNSRIEKVFGTSKPVFGMLHLKGDTSEEILERAKKEICIYEGKVDAVIVENYYGNYYHMRMVLDYLVKEKPNIKFGVNCLNMDVLGFYLAEEYGATFIQLDSVVGHMKPRDDYSMEAFLEIYRKKTNALLFGGVRFKYQPVLSERSLEDDLLIAKKRCDAVVVTGDGTGEETNIVKIKEFRNILGDFPLIVGAGITPTNAMESMEIADGAIVGSYFKTNHVDSGELDINNVTRLMETFTKIRRGLDDKNS